jgi:hypothetical protein
VEYTPRQNNHENYVQRFFDEYYSIINDSIETGITLTLMTTLEQLFFIDAEIYKEATLQDGHSRYNNLKEIVKE